MPRLVIISDTHEQHEKLTLPEGDILIHAGDYTYNGDQTAKEKFFVWLGAQKFRDIIFVAGNHDFNEPQEPSSVMGIHYLYNSGVRIGGLNFWVSPYTPRFGNWAFMEDRGAAIREHWKKIPIDTNVLITHGPPYNILDRPHNRYASVGCEELANFVVQLPELKLHVFGHIHGAAGIQQYNGTTFVNASVVGEDYVVRNKPVVVDL